MISLKERLIFNILAEWLVDCSLITGNVMSEFCETSPGCPINDCCIVIKFSLKIKSQEASETCFQDCSGSFHLDKVFQINSILVYRDICIQERF